MDVRVDSVTVIRRIWLELLRSPRTLVLWAVFPAVMLLLFGLIDAGGGYAGFSCRPFPVSRIS